MQEWSRRGWLSSSLVGAASGVMASFAGRPAGGFEPGDGVEPGTGTGAERGGDRRAPVAAVVTVYRKASHADVLLGKILEGYRQDGGAGPALRLVSLYVDQRPPNDLSRELAQRFSIRLSPTIADAVTLGGDRTAVAGVLSIGEHGDYPETPDTRQTMYPRRRFFDEITAACERGGRYVPVFNDKHLGYRWADAAHMVETAERRGFVLSAGSSLPVAWRAPAIEPPVDCEIEAALTIGYGGFEAYGFHAIEAHQCCVERRRGGETGVAAVRAVAGPRLLEAPARDAWSRELLDAALQSLPGRRRSADDWRPGDGSGVFLCEHRDGLRSAVLIANGLTDQFVFAARLKGRREPFVVRFQLQDRPPYGHFAYLLRAFEQTVLTGRPASPVKRTLLATGVLDRVMQSLAAGGVRLETPELDVRYRPGDWPFANRHDSPLVLPPD